MQQTNQARPAAQNGHAETPVNRLSDAMEALLAATPSQRFKAIDDALQSRVDRIEELLPPQMKGQGQRLAKRAILTLNRKADDYKDVTPASFVRCVLEAAECGFAIDGKYAYAIVYNVKVSKKGQPEKWEKQAQMQLDYKALVALARRLGIVTDAYARLVYEKDAFEIGEENGKCSLRYSPALQSPGKPIGAYAVVSLPGGSWRWEWMSNADIDAIRARSKSWNDGRGFGPWKTDDGEMRKKTVLRRLLKMYGDDPAMSRAMEIDDGDYSEEAIELQPKRSTPLSRYEVTETVAETEPDLVEGEIPNEEPEPAKTEAPAPTASVFTEEMYDDYRNDIFNATALDFHEVKAFVTKNIAKMDGKHAAEFQAKLVAREAELFPPTKTKK